LNINESYREDLNALNALFDKLNKCFFESKLSKPVITLQYDPKKRFGWFTAWDSWQCGENRSPEINVSTNFLDRDPIEKATTMLHDMCHLYAYQHNIKDCSRGDTYHNRFFKQIAEAHGLTVKASKKYGCGETSLTPAAREMIKKFLSNFTFFKRNENAKTGSESQSTRKYICPKCRQSVRATKDVNILCGICLCQMVKEESSKKAG